MNYKRDFYIDRKCVICGKDNGINHKGTCYCRKHYTEIIREEKNKNRILQNDIIKNGLADLRRSKSTNRIYEFPEYNTTAIKLPSGEITIIDSEDENKVINKCSWRNVKGYCTGCVNIDGSQYGIRMHRVVGYDMITDDKPTIDHKNGNKLDNRKINLRACSSLNNSANRIVGNDTGINLIKRPEYNKEFYDVRLMYNGKLHQKCADTYEEAVKVRKAFEEKYIGEFAVDKRINDGIYDKICEKINNAIDPISFY